MKKHITNIWTGEKRERRVIRIGRHKLTEQSTVKIGNETITYFFDENNKQYGAGGFTQSEINELAKN